MAFELLETIDNKEIMPHIVDALYKAASEEDTIWIAGIKRLVEHLKLKSDDFDSEEAYKLLELAEW